MSRPIRLAILLVALALTGSAHSITSPSAPAQAATDRHVCAGVSGCHQVVSVDVDGDGRPDEVGITSRRIVDDGSITVRVRTATGHTLQTTGRHVFWFAKPYVGAPALDGAKGAEIVVGDTMGAHYQRFRVVTYRSGRLVTLKAPPLVWTKAGLAASTARWEVDGAWSSDIGAARTSSVENGVRLTLKSAVRNESGTGHTGYTTSYRWHSGGWTKVSATQVDYASDKAPAALGGWHVAGLPRFVG